jgi:hypothetical protein
MYRRPTIDQGGEKCGEPPLVNDVYVRDGVPSAAYVVEPQMLKKGRFDMISHVL